MANKKKNNRKKKKINLSLVRMIFGVTSLFIGVVLFLSFVSFLFHWKNDQSQIGSWDNPEIHVENIFGKLGSWLGEVFIYDNLGATALLIAAWFILLGIILIFKLTKIKFLKYTLNTLFFCIWLPLFLSFILPKNLIWGGRIGLEIKDYLMNLISILGITLVLFFSFVLYAVLEWRITPEKIKNTLPKPTDSEEEPSTDNLQPQGETEIPADVNADKDFSPISEIKHEKTEEEVRFTLSEKKKETQKATPPPIPLNVEVPEEEVPFEPEITEIIIEPDEPENPQPTSTPTAPTTDKEEISLTVEQTAEEDESESLVQKHGKYDPHLDLSKYKFPVIDLLKNYNKGTNLSINQEELEANKNRIVETLNNYKIKIDTIKATVGPTVTLYEIVPEPGVRISKIKNLEDDIALSLSALGIRIIAPIPGKGTIGIEVPNSNPTMVSMRSVISSKKYQTSDMELPIAFGKTISNETFVADLAKMPHLLMAGATGQGKSVGINAIITSLLYKKHPSELKFVMVDPKKVELALYNKIERHFLAKLPGSEDAIITDNQKVINTLNSLCIEMDDRYNLLKDAYVRNIKEYNSKFKQRKLNPENGHRFMPYIVLVVDEFADLIMTAGKEVEAPIARLAQLARAVGIHLIIATQRPSVNVITGIIKANFPARAAFRVTSKIDSRTILDSGGADQLIGRGDMLYTKGNDLIRLQCAFVDTPEVEHISDYIGSQKGYTDAFLLPEYEGEGGDSTIDMDPNDRDSLFEEAARIIVNTQQGSTSMLQRKLKIGYNRAGRIIDQLEANHIVGPFEGSKAREVLIPDEMTLEQFLKKD